MLKSVIIIAFIFFWSYSWSQVAPVTQETELSFFDIMPERGGLLSNVVIDSQVSTARGTYTRVKIHLSCYATNLRAVSNPVAENSLITAYIDTKTQAGASKLIKIQFPADYLKPAATRLVPPATAIGFVGIDDSGAKISAYDNIIQVLIPNLKEMTITSGGEVSNVTEKNLIISGIRFSQGGAPGGYAGSYFGSEGPLSSRVVWYTSLNGKTIDIYADFPGAAAIGMRPRYLGETRTGFCGGYYSPLMMFFDQELPDFTATSKFRLSKNQTDKIYWPEAHSPGYFLVLDSKNDSQIKDGSQLFGDYDQFDNGFESLGSYDLNKDGLIDAKDKVFKQLKLWKDENADGVSQKGEVKTLKELGVTSISLKVLDETKKFGDRAEYKQKSDFKFKANAVMKSGTVLDIWLSPAPIK